MQNGQIKDRQITASSVRGQELPHYARLHGKKFWCARTKSKTEYLQVDLGKDAMIKKIATQGKRGSSQHTKTYTVSSRADGETDLVMYKEDNVVKVRQVLAFELSFLGERM